MDLLGILRTLGALGIVLGGLAGALWAVRRFDLRLPGAIGGAGASRRLQVLERTAIDARRALLLVRRDATEHLILLSPDGSIVVETAIAAPATTAA